MATTLYDLSGLEGRWFSPFGWRARMALTHKGLEADAAVELIRFSDKDKLGFSGQNLVPVLVDGETVVSDSWKIAKYLESTYPDAPSLFGGEAGEASARLITSYVDGQIHPLVGRCLLTDILQRLRPDDHDYFRQSREARFGMSLERTVADREETRDVLKKTLTPVRATLSDHDFLGGSGATYANYAVFGAFMWARVVSEFPLLDTDDPIHAWRERILDLFDGMPRRQPGFSV
jgi:glutathione S-transferase